MPCPDGANTALYQLSLLLFSIFCYSPLSLFLSALLQHSWLCYMKSVNEIPAVAVIFI